MTSSQQPASEASAPPSSPLGVADNIAQLMTMSQSLCKQRGSCCRAVTFKGSRSYEELCQLAKEETPDGEHARDFKSIFKPYDSQQAVPDEFAEFVGRVRQAAEGKGKNADAVAIYACKFVLDDGRCGVHEDRPKGCRAYPSVYKDAIFHPGCGFEATARSNWQQIETLIEDNFGMTADQLLGMRD
jgi:Fe-S-cluster containining protein